MSGLGKAYRLRASDARLHEVTQSYDAPELSPELTAALKPRMSFAPMTSPAEALAFKPGTDFYNGRTAKGRARRS